MKKLVFVALMVIGSLAKAQTTQDEYDYVTKGYAAQKGANLPDKAGYMWQQGTEFSAGARKISFMKLYQVVSEKEKNMKAILMIYEKDAATKEYICIPHPNSEQGIRDQYWNALYNNNTNDPYRMVIIAYNLPKMVNWYF
jgi:hypothetical protein